MTIPVTLSPNRWRGCIKYSWGGLNLEEGGWGGVLAPTSILLAPEDGGRAAARARQLSCVAPLLSASCDLTVAALKSGALVVLQYALPAAAALLLLLNKSSYHSEQYCILCRTGSSGMAPKLLGFLVSRVQPGAWSDFVILDLICCIVGVLTTRGAVECEVPHLNLFSMLRL